MGTNTATVSSNQNPFHYDERLGFILVCDGCLRPIVQLDQCNIVSTDARPMHQVCDTSHPGVTPWTPLLATVRVGGRRKLGK